MLPLTLHGTQSIQVEGLLDTGATLDVLPYSVGKRLGFDWDSQTTQVTLTGNLAAFDARVVVVSAEVASFSPVRLAFAWSKSDAVPIVLGQVNFFLEFEVCFFRGRGAFELRPKP